jgi:hypothetical protein
VVYRIDIHRLTIESICEHRSFTAGSLELLAILEAPGVVVIRGRDGKRGC